MAKSADHEEQRLARGQCSWDTLRTNIYNACRVYGPLQCLIEIVYRLRSDRSCHLPY